MRQQGRITRWNDERGFGFVVPDGGGEEVFLHIGAFRQRKVRPAVGDAITYTLGFDAQRRPQAREAAHVEMRFASRRRAVRQSHARASGGGGHGRLILLAVCGLGVWSYLHLSDRGAPGEALKYLTEPAQVAADPPARERATGTRDAAAPARISTPRVASYTCAGKTHCSQMQSCAEATFYLRNCPGSVMDGDGDGLPCEDQWCGH